MQKLMRFIVTSIKDERPSEYKPYAHGRHPHADFIYEDAVSLDNGTPHIRIISITCIYEIDQNIGKALYPLS